MTDAGPPDGTQPEAAGADAAERVDPLSESDAVGPAIGGADADADASAASDAFQTLASEVRVAVLCELLEAERRGDTPRSFSDLQEAAEVDSSAGFAYHLRQLSGRFVEEDDGGYRLTHAGRAAARAVVSGAFTSSLDADQAS